MRLGNPMREIRTIKALLEGAEAEAHLAGETIPGAEHLLLAALALPDGSARRAFERVGANPDDLRRAITTQHDQALHAIGISPVRDEILDSASLGAIPTKGVFRATAPAQAAFRSAVDLAKTRKPSQLVGAHVVAAVAEIEHGTAARTLHALGIDRNALGIAARQELEVPSMAGTG